MTPAESFLMKCVNGGTIVCSSQCSAVEVQKSMAAGRVLVVQAPDVYCVIGGEAERLAAFGDIHALRAAGYRVDYPLKEVAFGKQFKTASESGAKLALIYGGDELANGVVKLRDLTDRSERDVPRAQVVSTVRDFFSA